MSPSNWNSSGNANVFFVRNDGYLDWNNVNNTYGLRPISFLNSYTKLRQSIVELGYKIYP